MPELFSVVLTDPSFNENPANVTTLSECIQKATGIIPYDAIRYARDSQGVLIENIPYEKAENLVSELSNQGIGSGLVNSSVVPQTLEKKTVRQIEVGRGGVSVQTGYMGMEEIPWENISLVSICLYQSTVMKAVPEKKPRKGFNLGAFAAGAVGGVAGAAIYKFKKARKEAARHNKNKLNVNEFYMADIYTSDPVMIYRVKSNECLYNYLGSRVTERAEWNFSIVMNDIYNGSDMVMFSPTALKFIEGDSLQENIIVELPDFDNYNRWLFLAASAFADQVENTGEGNLSENKKSSLDDFAFE